MAVKTSKKLDRNEYPAGLGPNDFKCYGPTATKDTEFNNVRMADLGCFQQEKVDSNKYYHAAMVTDPAGKWYVYVQYGRQGASTPSFQFIECGTEAQAQQTFADQCAEKNTKRGEWKNIGGVQLYRPKLDSKGVPKDLYVVRSLASRTVGLPDAKNISASDTAPKTIKEAKKSTSKPTYRTDINTVKLWRDLLGGAISYARTTIQGGNIPVQSSLDQGRTLLQNAKSRIAKIGHDLKTQVSDDELKQLTYALYGLIPKVKPLHCAESDWILSQDNILAWEQDIDALETALNAGDIEEVTTGDDPMHGVPADMSSIDLNSDIGQYLLKWWPDASHKRHGYGKMRIINLWEVKRHGDYDRFVQSQESILPQMGTWNQERPLHQDKKRPDLNTSERKLYWETNTALTFHGTRTVNVPGIIKENLRLPDTLVGVHITGAMFGGGLYFADDWMKSAGYTSLNNSYYSRGSGAVPGRKAFMFACDTIMGKPHVAKGCHGYTDAPTGYHCVFGKAGVSGVMNNEWIVYKRNRNILRYLAEFECLR